MFISAFSDTLIKDGAAVEGAERAALTTQCFHILGCLCANSSYSSEAFRHISKHVKQHTRADDVLLVTKVNLTQLKLISSKLISCFSCLVALPLQESVGRVHWLAGGQAEGHYST